MDLQAKIKKIPDSPGVYLFKDRQGGILYVGKAKSLKKRLQSYFSRYLSSKTQALVSKIADIEYRYCSSESQAQLLEAALIKDKLPAYNVSLKDDKSFPLIKITDEEFPVVAICRRKKARAEDTALYFGSYPNAKLLRQAIKTMRQVFGFRSCKKMPRTACLYWRLKLCPAPCIGKISAKGYKEIIGQIKLFLASKYAQLLQKLSAQMTLAAQEERFEQAALIRNRIHALSAIAGEPPSFLSSPDELEDLKNLLKLEKLPLRIEAFDVSNISGREATGSMVSFYKGLPDKDNYRRFRIKTVKGIDDYGMLKEIIRRRYARLIEENLARPDLVLIDGGRAHLLAAHKQIKEMKIDLAVASIAKEKENIYILDKIQPIRLKQDTPALNLIRRIRDEAHRFAVKYHHLLRRKKIIGK